MKNLLETVFGWFTTPRSIDATASTATPEHERRLRELQEAGRVVFLP
jgi:hypothetical protein